MRVLTQDKHVRTLFLNIRYPRDIFTRHLGLQDLLKVWRAFVDNDTFVPPKQPLLVFHLATFEVYRHSKNLTPQLAWTESTTTERPAYVTVV
jgi:hypothetical protein